MSGKKFGISAIICILLVLASFAAVTVIIDPLFHYHKPIEGLSYAMDDERHQNDGITRQFEYDAIITGTSMSENFKASEYNELFGVNSIKVCYNGASFKELNSGLERAFSYNPEIKSVFRIIDSTNFAWDKDHMRDGTFPDYLYDNNIINDVNYLFNFEIAHDFIMRTMRNTLSHKEPVNFDTYASWPTTAVGQENIDKNRERDDVSDWYSYSPYDTAEDGTLIYTEETEKSIEDNLNQNVIAIAKAHPETDFHIVLPPYSIYFYDSSNQHKALDYYFACHKKAVELLVEVPNIHLYGYADNFELTCNLDHYIDPLHYADYVNSDIMKWASEGKGKLTRDNYEEYIKKISDFYTSYDYESLYN